MLEGYKDISQSILLKLDDKTLTNMCQVNKYTQKMCNDQNFWYQRVITLFHFIPIEILIKYKQNRSWSDYYIYDLRNLQYVNTDQILLDSALYNRVDHIIYALYKGIGAKQRYIDDALIWASQEGSTDVVKYLLSVGADIRTGDDYALIWASEGGHLDTVKVLVEAGANIQAHNNLAYELALEMRHHEIASYLKSLETPQY
jgi:hypothetical protein